MTEIAEKELQKLEEFIEESVSQIAGNYSKFVFKSGMYQEYTNKLFDILEMYIDDDGFIDGEQVHHILSDMFPVLTKWISVPQQKFKISDEINDLSMVFMGKEVI